MRKTLKIETILPALFLFYLAAVVWIILFKFSFSLSELDRTRIVNMIPFYGYVISHDNSEFSDVVNNVLIFIPFGIYMGALFPHWPIKKKAFTFFLMSLLLESFQYLLAIGRSDITDVITNTLGGVAGLILFSLFAYLFRTREKAVRAVTLLAFTGTSLMTCFLYLLFIINR